MPFLLKQDGQEKKEKKRQAPSAFLLYGGRKGRMIFSFSLFLKQEERKRNDPLSTQARKKEEKEKKDNAGQRHAASPSVFQKREDGKKQKTGVMRIRALRLPFCMENGTRKTEKEKEKREKQERMSVADTCPKTASFAL